MSIASIDPTTNAVIKEFVPLSEADILARIERAQAAYISYRLTPLAVRAQALHRAADILAAEAAVFGKIMTLEMGKTLKSAIAEVKKCAWVCRFYADHAADFLANQMIETDAGQSYIAYHPLGIVLAVMPWNFPFWQVFRFAAPALMAGNVGLLKHASNVPQSALAIADIIQRAGFPADVFQTLLISARQVKTVIEDDRVKAATLTGSEAAGASLASLAGQQIKKTVLELGGSDPFIVLPSADVDLAVATAVTARMLNNGQSCIAAKRFIVHDAIADQFETQLLARYRQLKIGDPMLDTTDIGPLATPTILAELAEQVERSITQGAQVLIGGKPLDQPGNFYPPTILTHLDPTTPIADEEFFGPVALLFRVTDIDAAIALANQTPFGLGASVWTQDETERDRLIREVEAGAVFVNGLVKSDPRLPFGGIKRSGYGRELGSVGLHEFVNQKTVWIR